MTYISTALADSKNDVIVWSRNEDGERVTNRFEAPYFYYVEDDEGTYKDLFGNQLVRHDFSASKDFFSARKKLVEKGYNMYESDISPEYKVLSQEFYGADIGNLNVTFFDIENDYNRDIGYATIDNPYAPINSVALYHVHSGRTVVLAVAPDTRPGYSHDDLPTDITDDAEVIICKDEKSLLEFFFLEIEDSDVISGWNSDFFDVPYVYERANRVMYKNAGNKLCFNNREPHYREVERYGNTQKKLMLQGRVSLDYLDVYKKFEPSEKSSYALENVAEEELPHLPKLEYEGSLYTLYRDNFEHFIRYNIRDTVILKGLEEKKKYIKLAIQMSHMATSKIEDVLGTIKVAEMSIINYCHYDLGVQVPNSKEHEDRAQKYHGGLVIPPKIGMHEWVASLDLASLYPSTMRSLNISPETIVGQFAEGQHAFEVLRGIPSNTTKLTFIGEDSGNTVRSTASKFKKLLIEQNWAVSAGGTVYRQDVDGVIPAILTTWFSERKKYKKLMNDARTVGDSEVYEYYDRLQYIKKIQLNSMYGACGSKYFKFYDVRLAESTTLSGQEILIHMASKVSEVLTGEYEVENDSIIYGDTDSVYFKTYKDNRKDALEVANHLCDEVNASYPKFMNATFNCDTPHCQLMKAEQEIITDRGIFIKKKYYILHLVSDDGKEVDEMKNMGVPIKKTTLPKPIKKKLSSFIERLLRGEDWDIIGREVVAFKEELKNLEDVHMFGLPKGVNKVEYYTGKFKEKEPGLRVPGHVSASILWNTCLKSYKDKDSPRIISGSKINVYYLTRPIDGFKSIAVPKDITVIPDWFTDHFTPLIDRDAQIIRLVDKPMEIMVSAAGIKVPTKKKLIFEDELFL
jgi:DNA polymerase elongation subunit (family B)